MSEIVKYSSALLSEHYYKINHDSGLRIFVFPKNLSTTYGIFSVNFGGNGVKYECRGEEVTMPQGCAHFLEHKLFENEDGSNADDIFHLLGHTIMLTRQTKERRICFIRPNVKKRRSESF